MYDLRDIVGHENIKDFIHNVLASKKIPHAFIFEGEKGCGKMLTAKTFAKILQCGEGTQIQCGDGVFAVPIQFDQQVAQSIVTVPLCANPVLPTIPVICLPTFVRNKLLQQAHLWIVCG